MTELTVATGIPTSHLYHALSPKGNPTLETLVKICEALGTELDLK